MGEGSFFKMFGACF